MDTRAQTKSQQLLDRQQRNEGSFDNEKLRVEKGMIRRCSNFLNAIAEEIYIEEKNIYTSTEGCARILCVLWSDTKYCDLGVHRQRGADQRVFTALPAKDGFDLA